MISGKPSRPLRKGYSIGSPKRFANARNCAGGRSWLRKNTTPLSSQIGRISATVASSRSRARSTPEISAPSAPAILWTSRLRVAGESMLAPHLVGHFDDHPELRPLFVFREDVALLGRGEAALRAERQLIERDVFGRLVDAALDV